MEAYFLQIDESSLMMSREDLGDFNRADGVEMLVMRRVGRRQRIRTVLYR